MSKKILTVDFVNFWPNFIKNDNYFCRLIENLLQQIKPNGKIEYYNSCHPEAKSLILTICN